MEKIKNIVFIDDDEIIGMVSKRLLEHLKIAEEIHVFSDSFVGMAYIEDRYKTGANWEQPEGTDLIFMDLDMPGLNGFTIMDKLLAMEAEGQLTLENTYFVIITSHKDNKEAERAATYPILDFLEKPLRPQQLEELLSKIPQLNTSTKNS
jgi:CheY-like chemotaxis protein